MIVQLLDRVRKLEERVNLDSNNSSKPPSSNGPDKLHRSHRRRSGRRRGAQPGHKGHSRALLDAWKVDALVDCKPDPVCKCGAPMHLDDEPRWHQVFDVPPMRARVDEYRIYSGRCKVCGKADAGALPTGVPTGQIGPRALALVGVLGTRYHLTQRKIRNLLAQLVGLDFSVGAISQAQGKVANALKTPVAQAASALASAPALWMDETTYPREGRTNWVWAAVQPKLAVFSVFPSRARYVLLELVGQNSAAVITSDRYAAYACVDPARRQVCRAHLLRDFNRIGQRAGQAGKVGERLLGLGLVMFRLRERGALQGPRLEGLQRRFKATLERGVGQTACTRTANTCANLLHLWPSLWTFTADASLAPTNNAAEQALRSLVLKRKISGPTRSLRGDQFLARGYTPACGKGAICGTSCIRRCGPSLPGPWPRACCRLRTAPGWKRCPPGRPRAGGWPLPAAAPTCSMRGQGLGGLFRVMGSTP